MGFFDSILSGFGNVAKTLGPIAGTVLGGMYGGPAGAQMGGMAGNMLGGLFGGGGGGGQQQQQQAPQQQPQQQMGGYGGYGGGGGYGQQQQQPYNPQMFQQGMGQAQQQGGQMMNGALNSFMPHSMQHMQMGQLGNHAGDALGSMIDRFAPSPQGYRGPSLGQTLGGMAGHYGQEAINRYMPESMRGERMGNMGNYAAQEMGRHASPYARQADEMRNESYSRHPSYDDEGYGGGRGGYGGGHGGHGGYGRRPSYDRYDDYEGYANGGPVSLAAHMAKLQ